MALPWMWDYIDFAAAETFHAAAVMAMSQTSGILPALYDNVKRKPKKRKK